MPVIDRLASSLGRRDEAPNIALAREIAAASDMDAVQELVDSLAIKNQEIQSDAIKVLYEIGALNPPLITAYVEEFVALLNNRNNRLVWGGMTALGAIVGINAAEAGAHRDKIIEATQHGSVITQDWGVRVLAQITAADETARPQIMPFLMDFLRTCPNKDLPRHAESVLVAVEAGDTAALRALLTDRLPQLKPAQARRLERLLRKIDIH